MIKNELKEVKKGDKVYYILDVYIVYESGKRHKLCCAFLQKHQYDKLKAGTK